MLVNRQALPTGKQGVHFCCDGSVLYEQMLVIGESPTFFRYVKMTRSIDIVMVYV